MLLRIAEDGSGDELCPDTKHSRISHSIEDKDSYKWLFRGAGEPFLFDIKDLAVKDALKEDGPMDN